MEEDVAETVQETVQADLEGYRAIGWYLDDGSGVVSLDEDK